MLVCTTKLESSAFVNDLKEVNRGRQAPIEGGVCVKIQEEKSCG